MCNVTWCRETVGVTGEEDGRHADLVEVVLWGHDATVPSKVGQGSVVVFGESASVSKKLKTKLECKFKFSEMIINNFLLSLVHFDILRAHISKLFLSN